jgi:DNA mismatch repair protein MutL
MPDKIQLLPDTVANQIAAGEVVQRPSSVLKELMENAIDAGATALTIVIKDGGSRLIQVVDDGGGMSHTDARMCWERHATSKIRKAEDLFSISTFGFRGEALASIASVARVELLTKMPEVEVGTRLIIEGGHMKKHDFAAVPNGTSISVRDLFYNIPARRNFLKSEWVESRHLMDEFIKSALSNPGVSFTYYSHDRKVFDLYSTALKNRICSVFPRLTPAHLLEVSSESDIVGIQGFIGKPEVAKKTRGEQFLYVNNRFVKDHYLSHAVKNAFSLLIPSDAHATYILFLTVPSDRIDVNVHPAKTEVKLEDDKSIYAILLASLKKALGSFVAPSMQSVGWTEEVSNSLFKGIGGADASLSGDVAGFISFSPDPKVDRHFTPFDTAIVKPRTYGWEKLYEPFKESPDGITLGGDIFSKEEEVGPLEPHSFSTHDDEGAPVRELFPSASVFLTEGVFQWEDLLVCRAYGDLYLVNILLARERVWYEKYLRDMESRKATTQTLLFPKTLVFSAVDAELLEHMLPFVRSIGFDISPFGTHTFIVNGLPADLPKGNETAIIEGILEHYKENRDKYRLEVRENVARSMARNAARMYPGNMPQEEAFALIKGLFSCEFPRYCPYGRPVYVQLSRNDILSQFKV